MEGNSVSLNLIKQFNSTVEKISYNEMLLDSRLHQIELIVQKTTFKENANYIKDTLNQIINIYEIIDSVLQDIENAITFSKLKVLHSSIIKTDALFYELQRIQKVVTANRMPLEVTLENTLLYEKFIKVESFIYKNKVNFVFKIPITHPNEFNYYRLYSTPVYHQSYFKVIIPENKFLLKNKLHFSYQSTECTKLKNQYYLCDKMELQDDRQNASCTIQLLEDNGFSPACHQIAIHIASPIVNQLDDLSQWIIVLPKEELVQLKCTNQNERLRLLGTYIMNIPVHCEVQFNNILINNRQPAENSNQLILFPDLTDNLPFLPTLSLSTQPLEEIKLDDLQKLKSQILETHPSLSFSDISKTPSFWTIAIYGLLILLVIYIVIRKLNLLSCSKKTMMEENPKEMELPRDVQLPRQAV